MDGGTQSSSDLPEFPLSPHFSYDELSDFLLDKTILGGSMNYNKVDLRHSEEAVNEDIKAADYKKTKHDDSWNVCDAKEPRDFVFPQHTTMWGNLSEDELLNKKLPIHDDAVFNQNIYNDFQLKKRVIKPSMYKKNTHIKNLESNLKVLNYTGIQKPSRSFKGGIEEHSNPKSLDECKQDQIPSSDDHQRVFLGGLPIGLTERELRQELAAQGYKVLKRPKVLRGFAPEVWLRSAEQVRELISKRTIKIHGVEVEVRPYNSLSKVSELKKIPNVSRRSVFLGGLSSGTTAKNIQDFFTKLGMSVINYPVIKNGFSRQVIFESVLQASTLIKMKKIWLNGKYVDVRPFVNKQRWKRLNKKTLVQLWC